MQHLWLTICYVILICSYAGDGHDCDCDGGGGGGDDAVDDDVDE